MANFEDELLLDAEHDAAVVAYMQTHLPIDIREKYEEDDLYYCLDLIETYLVESGVLEGKSDDDYIDIDLEKIASYITQTAKKDGYANFEESEVLLIAQCYFDTEDFVDED